MANELAIQATHGQTVYAVILTVGQRAAWNGTAFQALSTAFWTSLAIPLVEELGQAGGGTSLYYADFPPAVPAGAYEIVYRIRSGGAPSPLDVGISVADYTWAGVSGGNIPAPDQVKLFFKCSIDGTVTDPLPGTDGTLLTAVELLAPLMAGVSPYGIVCVETNAIIAAAGTYMLPTVDSNNVHIVGSFSYGPFTPSAPGLTYRFYPTYATYDTPLDTDTITVATIAAATNPYRITQADVESVVDFNPSITDFTPFIAAAEMMVNAQCVPAGYDAASLKIIETWLAAHFLAIRDPRYSSETMGAASASYQTQTGMNFALTPYGQQALILDYMGGLAYVDKHVAQGKRAKAGILHLGDRCKLERQLNSYYRVLP